jgi:tetratricopeptide (TPR) repeat protein
MMQGRSAEAIRAARDAAALMPVEMLRQMPGFDFALNFPIQALTRFGRWDDVLKEPAPPRDFPFATAMWHYARGRAFVGKQSLAAAQHELDSLTATLQATPKDAIESLNSARGMLAVAQHSLRGEILGGRKLYAQAGRELRAAIAVEDTLHYAEPPDWYYPIRHSYGALLLEAGRANEAEAVYRKDLEYHPENGWALQGLARALRAQKKDPAADVVEQRFAKAWKDADVKLVASDW